MSSSPRRYRIAKRDARTRQSRLSRLARNFRRDLHARRKICLRQQHADGHWCGELLVDSTLCSDFVLFMHWLGEVDVNLQERCARHILKRQLPDGGWNIYFGGPSEINASVKGYFALKLAGYSPICRSCAKRARTSCASAASRA